MLNLKAAALVASLVLAANATAQITYQGRLDEGGSPASGAYDLRFRLYADAVSGSPIGEVCLDNVDVTDGLFTVSLQFGNPFDGTTRFLEVLVRPDQGQDCTSIAGFTFLGARQPLTFAPMALFAQQAALATTAITATNATQLNGQSAAFYTSATNLTSGTIPSARISGSYSSAINLTNASNTYFGSGAGLSGLNAANIATGVIGDARLPTNLLRTDATTSILSGALRVGAANSSTVTLPPQFQIGPIAADQSALAFMRVSGTSTTIGARPNTATADGTLILLARDTDVNGSPLVQFGRALNDSMGSYITSVAFLDDGSMRFGTLSLPHAGELSIAHPSSTNSPHINLLQTGGSGFARLGFTHEDTDRGWVIAGRNSDASISSDRLNFFHNGGGVSGAGDVLSLSGDAGFGSGRVGVNTVNPIASLHVAGNLHLQGTGQDISVPTNETLQLGHYDGSTFTPRLFINPSGNSTFTGDVAAATATRWETIGAADMHAVNRMEHTTSQPVYLRQVGGVGANAVGTISLPHGATVTAIRARVLDSSPDADVRVRLVRRSFASISPGDDVTEAVSSGVNGSSYTISSSSVSNGVVDNQNYHYEVAVSISEIVGTGDVRFYRAQIEYTTPATLR
jgi:hypothetical protein